LFIINGERAMQQHLEAFTIVGLPVRTNNTEGFQTIGAHWQRFFAEQTLAQIPERASDDIYAVYTLFENLEVLQTGGIAQLAYTLVIGAAVAREVALPPHLCAVAVPVQTYEVFPVAKGQNTLVGAAWQNIWARQDLPRGFAADLERYRPGGEIDILIGLAR
jgi:predicted transcriptional regulator YdeE